MFCSLPEAVDLDAISQSILEMEAAVQVCVPGYHLVRPAQLGGGRVGIFIEVFGAGDFLPTYAGNLDVMTSAAARVGEEIAKALITATAITSEVHAHSLAKTVSGVNIYDPSTTSTK